MSRLLTDIGRTPAEPSLLETPTTLFTIGGRLRIRRLQLGTDPSGMETAREIGIPYLKYMEIERDNLVPTRELLGKLAIALGVSKTWLFHGHCKPGDPECWVDLSILPMPIKLAFKGLLQAYRQPLPPFSAESDLPVPRKGV